MKTFQDRLREFLHAATYRREAIDLFLDPAAACWAKFDPTLGYTLRSSFFRDGLHGSRTLQRYLPSGQRRMVNFHDQPCRINTYGNSFTQGAQVSDGETWQEVLAAHLCEPIRNFGVGGHGVYQAWRRLQQMEETDLAAPYLIFNIWGDDHLRSVNAWRWLTYFREWNKADLDPLFHSNPWDHARLCPESGELVEIRNLFPNPEDLYQLTDPEFVHETFRNDPIVRLLVSLEDPSQPDHESCGELARSAGWSPLDFSTPERARETLWNVYHAYGLAVTVKVLEKLQGFVERKGGKLLVVLTYPDYTVREVCAGIPRSDTSLPDWHPPAFQDGLRERGLRVMDTLPLHEADFATMRLTPGEYISRYYIGHYNPLGNHFLAHGIRGSVVDWLDPKPPAYRDGEDGSEFRFTGYLPGS